jgi:hypothetical protein
VSRENVELVKSVHPLSGTSLSSLFDGDAEGPLERLASLLSDDFEAIWRIARIEFHADRMQARKAAGLLE